MGIKPSDTPGTPKHGAYMQQSGESAEADQSDAKITFSGGGVRVRGRSMPDVTSREGELPRAFQVVLTYSS